jgi:hypothetical protein
MGGYGSTRWNYHRSKETADNCYHVTIKRLKLAEVMEAGRFVTAVYSWGDIATIGVHYYPQNSYIKFVYDAIGNGGKRQHFNEIVKVSKSSLYLGGFQYFVHCPNCQRRGRTLYRPAYAVRYLCRDCHDLSYISSQESHKDDRGYLVGLKMSIVLMDKIDKLQRKLYRKRPGSRAWRRLDTKLSRLERKAGVVIAAHRLGIPKGLAKLLEGK